MNLLNPKYLVLGDQMLYSGTNFLTTLLLARLLEISEFGRYTAVVLFAYLFMSAISAWTVQVFQVANSKSAVYLSFVFWFHLFLALIGVGGVLFISFLINFRLPPYALVFVLGLVFHDFGRKTLLALGSVRETFILDFLFTLGIFTALFFFSKFGQGQLEEVLKYFSIAFVPAFIFSMIAIKPFQFNGRQWLISILHHGRHGKWLFLTAISQWWASNLFVVASGVYLGAAALGALRLGQSIFGIINLFLQSYENYILPQSAVKLKQNIDEGILFIRQENQKLGLVFFPVLLLSFLFPAHILEYVGGTAYSNFGYVVQGLCLLYVLIFYSQPLRFVLRSLQLNRHFFIGYLVSLGFALLSSSWLISNYRLLGVLSGLIISQLLLLFYWSIILKLKKIKIWKSYILF